MQEVTKVLPGVVVDAAWLADNAPRVVVADVRWYLDGRSGRAAYEAAHIPGAVFVDLDTALAAHGDPSDGRHPLPDPDAFAATIGTLGIGDDDAVVAYDDAGGAVAGRLVWMLRAQGGVAALLDGGLKAWPGSTEAGSGTPRPPAHRTPRPWPADRLAHAAEVAAPPAGTVVLDARSAERYRGDTEPVDARAGHIPGARNLPVGSVLDPATGRLRPPAELRERFAAVGVAAGAVHGPEVVASCGSGVSACLLLVAMEHAGLDAGRLFVPSFSGWSADPARAIATGDEP